VTRYLLPLGILVALVVLLGVGLGLNPRLVPSPLVGKPTPEFSLPRLRVPEETLSREDLTGKVSLFNVWATWCVGCREEHPVLVHIAEQEGLPIYGLNYKDKRPEAIQWLQRFGDPYVASGFDADGRVGIDLGVYGLPETFVVDDKGMIVYKHIGPVSVQIWQEKMLPIVRKLQAGERG
jgi:cytochrome c biogenesis protein CcmG/thiol:disulfide interchange protein DsbE